MNIFLLGTVEFSYNLYSHLLGNKDELGISIVGIASLKTQKINSDYKSLQDLADHYSIPFYLMDNNQDHLRNLLIDSRADALYCFGWPFLLKQSVLEVPKLGCFGYHPAKLPHNRGRHPIIWSLALGLSETASTFFAMEPQADTGGIVSQVTVKIDDEDNAATLYSKLNKTACNQLITMTRDLLKGCLERTPQSGGTSWRKRSRRDGIIDWRMSAINIHNLIRALHPPYPMASCLINEQEIAIKRSRILQASNENVENVEPGKILNISEEGITIKCGEGILEILEMIPALKVTKGQYL